MVIHAIFFSSIKKRAGNSCSFGMKGFTFQTGTQPHGSGPSVRTNHGTDRLNVLSMILSYSQPLDGSVLEDLGGLGRIRV